MTRLGRFLGAALLTTFLGPWTTANAQGDCLNETLYPGNAITPNSLGQVTTISTISYEQEYSAIVGVIVGAQYEFTLSSGGYITVRQGSYDGVVIGQGTGNVTVLATTTDTLFAHWNTNETCGTNNVGTTTTVQLLLDCTPPTVEVSYTEDCDLSAYYIEVNIISTGDEPTVDVIVEQGGVPTITEDVGTGVVELGPFFLGDDPNVTVAHATDHLCNIPLGVLVPFSTCPIIVSCALGSPVVQQQYCYGNSEVRTWLYQALGTGTMRLSFNSGGIQGAFSDSLRIYGGQDNTGVLLYEHVIGNTVDLTGVSVLSSSGYIFMEMSSDAFTSCADGGFEITEWVWEVACGDCQLPEGSATFATDCASESFTVTVDITGLGDAPTATINYSVNGAEALQLANLPLGPTVLGPFPHGDTVSVVLQHAFNAFCEVDLGSFADPGDCPNLITCGAQPEILDYCYSENDRRDWLYQTVGSGTMRLRFLKGTIESANYDSLLIYDGADNTAPLLFQHTNTVAYNLGPVGSAVNNTLPQYYDIEVFATGNSLYMEMNSDVSGNCGGQFPSTTYDSWQWEVVCLDCTIPQVDYSIVDDCANAQFSIPIEVATTGDGSTVTIIYTINGGDPQTVVNVGVGTAEIGPFALNDTVNVTVAHASNELCNVEFGDLTDTGTCPILIDCGTELTDSTCYGNFADLRYYYRGTGTFPLGVFFDSGLLFFGDSLIVYDGGDITAPRLYSGTNLNVTGLFVNTTNPEHRVTIQVKSNDFTSCEDGFEPEQVLWRVACLDCVPAAVDFNIVQDCDNFQFFVDVVITDLGTDAIAQVATTASQDTLEVTAPGTYQLGPYVSGTELEVTVVNDANFLCNVYSGTLVNPLCPDLIDCPGPTLEETYCYVANDNHAWAYELVGGSGTTTLRLTFLLGTIESNTFDHLRIYDGPDNTSPILFEHLNAQRRHLGPEGSATTDPAPVYYAIDVAATGNNLYMEMSSDGSVECGSVDFDEWEWEVYCLDCSNPTATFNIIEDCVHRQYTTEVIVTEEGGDDGLTISNTLTGDVQSGLGIGVYTFGPYPADSLSVLRVSNETYEQCKVTSDTLTVTAAECISVTCGFDNYSYCYGNNEDRWYTFQSAENVPMTIGFLQGQMLSGDRIILYNGRNELAPVLYQGNNGGNLIGFAINSANVDNIITMRIQSNESGSCEDGQVTVPLTWNVACGAVGLAELAYEGFAVYPNPTQGVLQIELGSLVSGSVRLQILDMSGRVVMDQPLLMNGGTRNTVDMRGLQSGNYMVQLTTNKWVKTQRVQLAR